MTYAVGVDIGGTFTDFVFTRSDGVIQVKKVLSTPDAPDDALMQGLAEHAAEQDLTLERFLSKVEVFVHGTTIATNTVIQRSGPRVGLICTQGHRDVLAIRDGYKWDRFNIHMDPPDPFVPRRLRIGVSERIDHRGEVVVPLELRDVDRALTMFRAEGVQSIGVALLWSVLNPDHEQRVRQYIEKQMPEAEVVLSSDVLPMLREWPRTSATVLAACIKPSLKNYLRRLAHRLAESGFTRDLLIMQASGGTSSIDEIERRPIFGLGSGPAAAPAAGLAVADELGLDNVITADMGGTSFDVCLVTDRSAHVSSDLRVDQMPIGIQAIESHSIGAGGGSIAWIDSGGALRVGPRSAGSVPGPASYGRGGDEPTVSDANLVLGYLSEENLLGGSLRLDRTAAEEAIASRIAKSLAMSVSDAAYAIFTVVSHSMVEAIKVLSVQRGIDPRDYGLVVGGGAGGIHGSWLAAELGMTTVVSPREAGGFCAMGMIAADVRHDYLRAAPQRSDACELQAVNSLYADLEAEAAAALAREGIRSDNITLVRSVDAKYDQQLHELTVPVPSQRPLRLDDIDTIAAEFHRLHERLYTFSIPEARLEFYHWRLTALGRLDRPMKTTYESGDERPDLALRAYRDVLFDRFIGYQKADIYDGDALRPGMTIPGPAIIERVTTTIVVRPGERLRTNHYGSFVIERTTAA